MSKLTNNIKDMKEALEKSLYIKKDSTNMQ